MQLLHPACGERDRGGRADGDERAAWIRRAARPIATPAGTAKEYGTGIRWLSRSGWYIKTKRTVAAGQSHSGHTRRHSRTEAAMPASTIQANGVRRLKRLLQLVRAVHLLGRLGVDVVGEGAVPDPAQVADEDERQHRDDRRRSRRGQEQRPAARRREREQHEHGRHRRDRAELHRERRSEERPGGERPPRGREPEADHDERDRRRVGVDAAAELRQRRRDRDQRRRRAGPRAARRAGGRAATRTRSRRRRRRRCRAARRRRRRRRRRRSRAAARRSRAPAR